MPRPTSLHLPQESPDGGERASLAALLEPLQEVCGAHAGGKEEYARALCARLMEAFLAVEERFENGGKSTEQEVIDSLRQVGVERERERERVCVCVGGGGGGGGQRKMGQWVCPAAYLQCLR